MGQLISSRTSFVYFPLVANTVKSGPQERNFGRKENPRPRSVMTDHNPLRDMCGTLICFAKSTLSGRDAVQPPAQPSLPLPSKAMFHASTVDYSTF